jgi:hypothetical protein
MAIKTEVRTHLYTRAVNKWRNFAEKGMPRLRVPPSRVIRKNLLGGDWSIIQQWHAFRAGEVLKHIKGTMYVIVDTSTGEILHYYNIFPRRGIGRNPYNNFIAIQMIRGLFLLSAGIYAGVEEIMLPDYPPPDNLRFPDGTLSTDEDSRFYFPVIYLRTEGLYRIYDIVGTYYYVWNIGNEWFISTYRGDIVPGFTWVKHGGNLYGEYSGYDFFSKITIQP